MSLFALEPWQLALLFAPALLNLWAIWHAGTRQFPSPLERMGWMGLGIFVPLLGGLIYLCCGMRRARRPSPKAESASSSEASHKND